MRDRRRLLKNRQYGQWGRDRRSGTKQEHEKTQETLRQQVDAMNAVNKQLAHELEMAKQNRHTLESQLNVQVMMATSRQ